MSAEFSAPTRRSILATSAAASAIGLLPAHFAVAADDNTIRPFRVNVPDAATHRSSPAHCGDPLARPGDCH